MVLFLTSSPSGPLDKPNDDHVLDFKNGFVSNLKSFWKDDKKALMIAASPNCYDSNDEMTSFFYDCFNNSGLPLNDLCLWDDRYNGLNIQEFDLIVLAGGHLPTQNEFFKNIQLKEKLVGYKGIILGISAGTMNSADIVYAQPEMEGESIDLNYQRFISGLNLTSIKVLPHYQKVKDYYLDGRRLFEDITYMDSYGKRFIVLNDGSYILQKDNEVLIFGESYLLSDGIMNKICNDNENVLYHL